MNVRLDSSQSFYSLKLTGELGFDHLMDLVHQAQHIANQPKDTEVDWSGARWMHFACLQVLLSLKKSLANAGKRIHFTEPSPEYREALTMFGMATELELN